MIHAILEWLRASAQSYAPLAPVCVAGQLPAKTPAVCIRADGGGEEIQNLDARRVMRYSFSVLARSPSQAEALALADVLSPLCRQKGWETGRDDFQIVAVEQQGAPAFVEQSESMRDYVYASGLEVHAFERD